MADCGRQLHTTITIGSQLRQQWREMPRLPVFIPAGDAREDGLIFKQHMQLAYSKSADELGEAVAEQAAAATDLPLPAYHLLLLCLCHACT